MNPLLEIDSLTLRVGQSGPQVVKQVSFHVGSGEIVGVVGESGSGKTMVARAIMKLLPKTIQPSNGKIRFNGEDVFAMNGTAIRSIRGKRIAMIFQEPMTSLNPSLTIGRQLEEGLELHYQQESKKERRLKIINMLEKVGIKDGEKALSAHPHQFSGGMRQRIMIASAMLLQPDLLIADEPTTALDAVVQREIMELLLKLTRENSTSVLLISHDLPMVARYCDRIVVMRYGDLVEEGLTEQVLSNPQHDYTRKLLSTLPRRIPARAPASGEALMQADNIIVDFIGNKSLFQKAPVKTALDDVSVTIFPKEVVAIVGGSGSGKTTLARVIAGLVQPKSGTLNYKGQQVSRNNNHFNDYRFNCQLVFQDPYSSLDPRMKIGQLVAEPLRLSEGVSTAEKSALVKSTLEDVGLGGDFTERFPHELSGGQRQRVAIARALVRRPAFLIADEAVSALDVTVRAQVLDLLAELQERYGFACLFISHDLGVVEQIADRVVVMKDGKIIEQGTRDAIFDHPQTDYTRQLLSAIPILETTGTGGVRLKWRNEAA
ncbi:ABC transporter ATP-binding protein [Pseudochrobactrum algeriensis]|uniref:ABC transporter ATP-binding protein n=1 Tax=Pseudochrobactrum algeriensis TaxID=2834768 RepID=UPI001BCFAC94|nr:ABC transporter ATP-binding protein [Pseudochrobactrum algeriensis]QVQ36286.1 ABC transporter ATP-binding protein [Pseudochrobactrum algeriensis]QVQ39503.1 ABC transporter ATP-binding protein [Pseudochrobactrum algeriensis]QVQ43423.1 ABC transporter ATP-binding protein [Pseudochrobactrum algeriensis]